MKVLHVSLGKHQTSQSKALRDIADEYVRIDWTEAPEGLDATIRELDYRPDLTFMQLQRENLVKPETLKGITGKKYNWTGDVRFPIPKWYKDLAPYFDATIFSNGHDVAEFKKLGLSAEFLNIGFEEPIYKLEGHKIDSGVVFMGNNYKIFPLSQFREQMVRQIPFIEVYGANWTKAENLNDNPEKEAAIYRGCKMAISLSHFDYDRYYSDRMLRIMACGALCLSHHYKGIEKDFKVGVDVVTWKTIPELKEKIDYYLANPDEAKKIAAMGYHNVWANHRWENRVNDLLKLA